MNAMKLLSIYVEDDQISPVPDSTCIVTVRGEDDGRCDFYVEDDKKSPVLDSTCKVIVQGEDDGSCDLDDSNAYQEKSDMN